MSSPEATQSANDSRLIAGIRSGDPDAMSQLYDRYSGIVYSVALRVLGETTSAEDVLQEVFMRLWRSPGMFDASRGNLGAWLAVSARNRAIDLLRKRRPEQEITDFAAVVDPDLANQAMLGQAMDKVRIALGDMPQTQRSALELAYFEGLSHSEIASKLGEPLGTVKTRIRSGLVALRKVFA